MLLAVPTVVPVVPAAPVVLTVATLEVATFALTGAACPSLTVVLLMLWKKLSGSVLMRVGLAGRVGEVVRKDGGGVGVGKADRGVGVMMLGELVGVIGERKSEEVVERVDTVEAVEGTVVAGGVDTMEVEVDVVVVGVSLVEN